ncbi:MAG: hypothetical protein RLZZ584_422, partial [Pseudomonadota bacterium]
MTRTMTQVACSRWGAWLVPAALVPAALLPPASVAAAPATGPAAAAATATVTAGPPAGPARLAWLDHPPAAPNQVAAAATAAAPPGTAPVWTGWQHALRSGDQPLAEATARTPLGSVWKLFVHGYLSELSSARTPHEPAYRCAAQLRLPDEEYCCEPGASVGRDAALAQSCGPYFQPGRLGISAAAWAAHWRARQAPTWLTRLDQLQPGTELPVAELLAALAAVPPAARAAARQALLAVAVRDPAVLGELGSGPRYKTWSWRIDGQRGGGAAGWLGDGRPFWFGASAGSSRAALAGHAAWLARQLDAGALVASASPPPRPDGGDTVAQLDFRMPGAPAAADLREPDDASQQPCVDVHFFRRYPIRRVTRADGSELAPGALNGRVTVEFVNGQRLVVMAVPALTLRRLAAPDARPGDTSAADGSAHGAPGAWTITARLTLEDYVARVVDREGRADETAAARALAVAARSYLLQNTTPQGSDLDGGDGACRAIADDSRTQRVSPQPPSASARAAAAYTAGLVISGAPVRYHLDRAAPGVLAWQDAVAASRRGESYGAILAATWPAGRLVALDTLAVGAGLADGSAASTRTSTSTGSGLAGLHATGDCRPLPQARAWLSSRARRWRERLQAEAGYQPPGPDWRVCELAGSGPPWSDQRRGHIHVRDWSGREGRVALIHE